MNSLAQGHPASKEQSWDLNAALPASHLGGSELLGSGVEGKESGEDRLLLLRAECVPKPYACRFLLTISFNECSSPREGALKSSLR